jgi:hypothetical protein
MIVSVLAPSAGAGEEDIDVYRGKLADIFSFGLRDTI